MSSHRHLGPRRRTAADDLAEEPAEVPLSGKPLRNRGGAADPRAAAPTLALEDLPRLCGRGQMLTMGTGDLRTPVDRPGAHQAASHPSRRGDLLYHRDGRITDLNGNCVTAPEVPRCSLPDSVDRDERMRRLYSARIGATGRAA